MSAYRRFLKTLRRVPDDVILSMATRPINLYVARECVCGWAAREVHARHENVDAADAMGAVTSFLAQEFGGHEYGEWLPINWAYSTDADAAALELAFVERVLEAVA